MRIALLLPLAVGFTVLSGPALTAQPLTVERVLDAIRQTQKALETCVLSFTAETQLPGRIHTPPAEVQQYFRERILEDRRRQRTPGEQAGKQARPSPSPSVRFHHAPVGTDAITHTAFYAHRSRGMFRAETTQELSASQRGETRKQRGRLEARLEQMSDKARRELSLKADLEARDALKSVIVYDGDKLVTYVLGGTFPTATIMKPGQQANAVGNPLSFGWDLDFFLQDRNQVSLSGVEQLQNVTHYVLIAKSEGGTKMKAWIAPERGCCGTRLEQLDSNDRLLMEREGFDWKEVAPGFWFPMRGVEKRYRPGKEKTPEAFLTSELTIQEVKVNPPLSSDLFTWRPTRVTLVTYTRFHPPLSYEVSADKQHTDDELVRMHLERKEKAEKLKQEREQKQQAPKQ